MNTAAAVNLTQPTIEPVHVVAGQIPADYHCRCQYCSAAIGELRREDGSYYSRLDRNAYYDPKERGAGGHVAKTPLHLARWAIQQYTKEGDWVLDPTIGAGTTAVEALVQGRNAAGMELQFGDVLAANVARHAHPGGPQCVIRLGDARRIGDFLKELGHKFQLVVNNPPYSGDESDGGIGANHPLKDQYTYRQDLPNIAHLREGSEYWKTIAEIYASSAEHLVSGGHFVVGVKDQMRQKKPDQLHEKLGDVLAGIGLKPVGGAFLRHHPGTLHLNTYEKRTGVPPTRYQSIVVFQKP